MIILQHNAKKIPLISGKFYFCSAVPTGPCFSTLIIRNQATDALMKVNRELHCLLFISEDWNDSSRDDETWFLSSLCPLKHHTTMLVSVPDITIVPVFSPFLIKQIFQDYFQLLLHVLPFRGRVSLCNAQSPAKDLLTHWPIHPL